MTRFSAGLLSIFLVACAGTEAKKTVPSEAVVRNSSKERLHTAADVEKIDIRIDAERSGHSLVVRVKGIGRGHTSGGELENPKAWHVTAKYGASPLRQVLAGPAKVSRAPTGAAMGDQWDIEVDFMVAFALPDRAGSVEVRVQAPSGETNTHKLKVEAPLEKLSLVPSRPAPTLVSATSHSL